MKKTITFFIILLSFLSAQTIGKKQSGFINLDFSRYQYDETSSYVEFYYSVLPNDSIINVENIDCFELKFSVFTYPEDKLQAASNIKIPLKNYRNSNLEKQASVGIIKTVLPIGEYRIEILPVDSVSFGNIKKVEKTFKLNIFKNDRITLSDIELANKISRSSDKGSVFYKNTLEIVPNPTAFFANSQNKVGYYIEVYNVNELGNEGNININASIVDLQGNVKDEKLYTKNKANSNLVEIGFLNINKLQSGYYTLIFSVTDMKEDYSIYRKKLIYVDNPMVKSPEMTVSTDEKYENSEFKYFPKELIDDKVQQSLYLASDREKEVVKKIISIEAKRKWLFNFWNAKSTIDVDFKDKFDQRVEQANSLFASRGKQGWKTDRGRVYILYGKPDDRVRNPSAADTNPYEEWKYHNVEGGATFYFIDEMGFGEYRLVHSTLRNEVYDPNWKNYLY